MGGQNGDAGVGRVPRRSARALWEGDVIPGWITRGPLVGRPVKVRVEWHYVPGAAGKCVTRVEVFEDGRKVNARKRRRWLAVLEFHGVTFERTVAALNEGRERVSEE